MWGCVMNWRASLFPFSILPLIATSSALADIGDPVPGLTPTESSRFTAGKASFVEIESVADGLGPVFNEASCATCHTSSGGAVGGNTTRVETRFGTIVNNVFSPLTELGGSLIQDHGIGRGDATAGLPALPECAPPFSFVGEVVPSAATIVAGRRTTPLFGLGFVDAVPEATFVALAASEAQNTPTTAGVVSRVPNADTGATNAVGRFGWKAQNATLHVFAGDAYLNEMGITNPSFPNENCPQGNCDENVCNPEPGLEDNGADVAAFTDFMSMLDAPPRGPLPPDDKEGEVVFSHLGCADCHTPTIQSGPSPIEALSNRAFHPYSDYLLHDMGALGDGITQNLATGRLMRTTPLWGLRFQTRLLHDGRATTVTAAIDAHAGQGATARAAFDALNTTQQGKLLAFLASL